ncbi:SPFH domain-containing protein [Streptomyces sp. NPDC127069]|uniref:SPFH domain-containing protein n=1 Tax=Streptomyces sp. NPDC127069 TaxID=3347128 RepID=UPI003669CF8A
MTSARAGHEAPPPPAGHPADVELARVPVATAARTAVPVPEATSSVRPPTAAAVGRLTEAAAAAGPEAGADGSVRAPARVGAVEPEPPTAPAPRTDPHPLALRTEPPEHTPRTDPRDHAPQAEPQPPAARAEFHPPAARTEPRPAGARAERQAPATPTGTAPQGHAPGPERQVPVTPAGTAPQGHAPRPERQAPATPTGTAPQGHAPGPERRAPVTSAGTAPPSRATHAEPQPPAAPPRSGVQPAAPTTSRTGTPGYASQADAQPPAALVDAAPQQAAPAARTGPQDHTTHMTPQPPAAQPRTAPQGRAPHPALQQPGPIPTTPQDHAPQRPATTPAPRTDPQPPTPRTAPRDGDVPAARGDGEGGGAGGIPHPHGGGVPGPGVAEIVAQAVARGIDGRDGVKGEAPAGPLARRGPVRGAAVTEVPVHLPFRARPTAPATTPVTTPAAAPALRPAERTGTAGRRVPRGDERLREHRGPVLPGWIAVVVGALALTGCAAVLWRAGVVPTTLVAAFGVPTRPYHGLRATHWPPLAFLGVVTLLALGGLGRAKAGHAWVLTLFGSYRGTVRRTGLTWISPLLLRRRVDVRLRHWRSEPMPAVDSGGLALQVVVQVVWQVRDTARATLAVEDHIDYLAEQVESATARVLSRLPADAFHDDAPTLRDAEAVGEALTRTLAAETEAVGIEVFSAQPTRIEYAPEVAEAMRRRRIAAIDAKHRDTVLTAVVDAVDDTVHRLTSRGIVELDDYERKALVKDLTVAFYTGRSDQ